MPPVPPNLPSVSRVVCHYENNAGSTAINVFHVLSGGAAALDTFNRFTTAWQAGNMAHTIIGVRLSTIDITRLDNSTATESFSTVGVKWDGTATGELIPSAALLLKYSTGFRGLAGHGRSYIPFVAEALSINGQIDPAQLATLQANWVTWVNTLTTQTIPLQVVSYGRFDHPTLPDAPATNHTVTAVTLNRILGTQRNRQSRLFG